MKNLKQLKTRFMDILITNRYLKRIRGTVFAYLIANAKSEFVKQLVDPEVQRQAIKIVEDLMRRKDMTNTEKAEIFNLKLLVWAKDFNKNLKDSTINCLRELALTLVKTKNS